MRPRTKRNAKHATRATLVLLLSALTAVAADPLVWFAPLGPVFMPAVGYGGSPQYTSLFTPTAPWRNAASRVNVFKIYGSWLFSNNDADLRAQFADLDRRGIALALEFGVLTTTAACGRDVEGFAGQLLLPAAQRIQQLGGTLRYIAMDEPVYYGTMYDGPNACHWTVEQMAADAATNIQAVLAQFPAVMVGDIEPFLGDITPNPAPQYQAGLEAFGQALGFPPAFFHADVLWPAHRDLSDVAAARDMAASEGIPFGVLYDGTSQDLSDAQWLDDAIRNMYLVELTLGTPDHVIFQSFNSYPKKLLPETDPDAFTSIIDRYFLRRTALQISLTGGALSGVLNDLAQDQPIAGAVVSISATPVTGAGVLSLYAVAATVPDGARFMVVGARVNAECECSGTVELVLSSLAVNTPSGTIERDFSQGLTTWTLAVEGSPTLDVEPDGLHLAAQAGQSVALNSTPISTIDARQVTFQVNAKVAPASSGNGYFMLAFLDAGFSEIGRIRIPFAPAPFALGQAATDSNGGFTFALPPPGRGSLQIVANFTGNDETWPAQSAILYSIEAQRPSPGPRQPHAVRWSKPLEGIRPTVRGESK